jgi:transcriptional regulator with XRE-family HTH domain
MDRPHVRTPNTLIALGQQALGLTQEQMGEALGASMRTAQRWASGELAAGEPEMKRLAALLLPVDRALAVEAAAAARETLVSLGLEGPSALLGHDAATPPPLAPPIRPVPLVVDSVVCAAADAMKMTPGAVRDALRVAFARARALRLTVEDVDDALSSPPALPPAPGVPAAALPRRRPS